MSRARELRLPCVVRVEHGLWGIGAHVEIEGDPRVGPGDRVRVEGPPIAWRLDATVEERRTAVLTRATWLGRLLARLEGRVALHELYEVSFTPGRL
jgi:hypothetical protein